MSSNSAAPAAAAVAATTASDDTMVIVSSVLSEFHDQNSPATVVSSSKILVKLLQNAIKETDDPKKQEMYRKVRMGNAKIQQHIVNVPGACDVLGLAGFSEEKIDNDRFLVYYPQQQKPGEDNALELYLADGDQPKESPSHALIHAICQGLEAKQKELEAQKEQQQSPSKPAASSNANNNNSPFLSEEERLKRAAKIKAMKQAKKKERAAAKERWNEDEERRKEAQQRREALLNAKVQEEAKQGLAANVTIRTAAGDGNVVSAASPQKQQNLPKPFEVAPSLADPKAQLAAAARARMQRAQAAAPSPQAVPAAAANDETAMDVETPVPAAAAAYALPKPPPKQQPSKDDVPMEAEEEEEEEKWENQKPAAKPAEQAQQPQQPQFMPVRPDIERTPEWDAFLERVPRCAGAEGIRESSVFAKEGGDGMVVPQCLKRLFKELDGLKDSLPADPNCSIWLRFDEETPQYIRALMAAPLPGPSPYSGGLFAFDIFVPGDYPQVSPKVQFLSTGGGTWRAGPNLYACGKVCLSLLGTWSGEKWNPAHSSLYQVLLSIQGLILGVEHPFYLEPGHGGWEGNVKDGAFQQSGQTLAGEKVQTEVGVPQNVVIFEDLIRVGTTKYAMIQPLKAAARLLHDKDGSSKKKDSMFAAFGEIIQTHFGHSREAVLTEVRTWMTDHCVGRNRKVVSGSLTIDQLQDLMPKLEQLLSEIPSLAGGAPLESTNDDAMVTEEEDKKVAAKPPPPPAVAGDTKPASSAAKRTTSGETKPASVDFVEAKRQKMQEAASQGDYVLAGQLQEEVKRLEDLQRSIQEAAQQNDFIRAGRLQAQLKALTAIDDTKKPARKKAPPKAMWDQGGDDDDDMLDDDDGEDVDDDDSMDSDDEPVGGGGGPPFAMGGGGPPQFGMGAGGGMPGAPHYPPHGLGKNVFAPPSYKSKFANKHHSWGTGNALGNTASEAPPEEEKVAAKPAPAAAKKKSIPPEQLCRLRIRLPNNKSVIEDFDKEDQLSAVYRRLAPMVPEDGTKKKKKSNTVSQPASASGTGAFAKPLSSAGFTLLLTRPKREFSLEMHGVKTLLDLNLAPSATLTVMKCSDRGIMYRGELESRLQGAQGDAMEVDGLTYEGLVELTERVGAAAPDMNEEDLENNTETISPAAYLAELDASMEEVSQAARKCPICLGAYDAQDTTGSLRKLKNCGHIFHCGCVETWLETKASCPLCKTSVKPEK